MDAGDLARRAAPLAIATAGVAARQISSEGFG